MAHAYKNKGKILCEMGNYEEAFQCCEEALNISPTMAAAYAVKAEINNRIARNEEALRVCKSAIEQGIEDDNLYYEKGEAEYAI